MKVRYRVMQCRWPIGEWRNWGFFYELQEDPRRSRSVVCYHNLNEFEWMVHDIKQCVNERCLSLERIHEAVAQYSDTCRVLHEIRTYEADDRPASAATDAIEALVLGLEYMAPHDASEELIRVFSGTANRPLAQTVALLHGFPLSAISIAPLPDSEIHVQIHEAVRGK